MLKTNDKILDQLFKSSVEGEGKFLTEISGKIRSIGENPLDIGLGEGDNIFDFINADQAYLPGEKVKHIIDSNIGLRLKFKNATKSTQSYQAFVSTLKNENQTILFFQIFTPLEKSKVSKPKSNKKKRIDEELMLRTQEINMTHEIMSEHGGYLSNFLRGLRHDLISPIVQLQEIIAYHQEATDPEKKAKSKKLIDVSLNKLANTANGFSEFVDIHYKYQHDFEVINLKGIFEKTSALFEEEIKAGQVNYNVNFDDAPTLFYSEKYLGSILYNLLSNSIKFRSDKRPLEIELTSYKESDNTVLVIKDNGIGFDAEKYKDQLFQPFKKLNNTHTGAGVGLSLIHSIVNRNGGEISINAVEDKGCEVKIVFAAKDLTQ